MPNFQLIPNVSRDEACDWSSSDMILARTVEVMRKLWNLEKFNNDIAARIRQWRFSSESLD